MHRNSLFNQTSVKKIAKTQIPREMKMMNDEMSRGSCTMLNMLVMETYCAKSSLSKETE